MSAAEDNLEVIAENYFEVFNNFEKIAAACTTPAQKKQLEEMYQAILKALLVAGRLVLEGNSAFVKSIRSELETTTNKLKADLSGITSIASTLLLIAQGLQLAATLTLLAA